MGPDKPLPYNTKAFTSTHAYVDSLLEFVSTNDLLRTFCGGVHVLDFFTSTPDLYSRVLPQEWRDFFAHCEMMDLLDLFMREDLNIFAQAKSEGGSWRNGPMPPKSLIDYITTVRKHLLSREPQGTQCSRNRTQKKLARHISVGMNVKKVHEVGIFASYIDSLATNASASMPDDNEISHLVDFGSGQSYLGRALAFEPYNRNIVAIESKTHNTERAKNFDVRAKLVEKNQVLRNKKAYRAGLVPPDKKANVPDDSPTVPSESSLTQQHGVKIPNKNVETSEEEGKGRIQHIEHQIHNGDLTNVISSISSLESTKSLMVISLHSCGNLVHHGLRSLVLNPSVKAVAMVGCCYNLLTERLGPATYKFPELRPTMRAHPRLEREGAACDPDGFPMSDRLCEYGDKGIRLNITARMMAVQAPANWGEKDSESFFTRHFYRALLQRVFLDRGVVQPPPNPEYSGGVSPAGCSSLGTPILIGALRKSCYANFTTYVRSALDKLCEDPNWGEAVREKMDGISDAEIAGYEERFRERKKDLSVVWSLMAFSAGVVEAAIVVDRWLWLQEQEEVEEAWVEAVFDYGISPRNLVVVGVKK